MDESKLRFEADLTLPALIARMKEQLSPEGIILFIKELDKAVANLDFTLELRDYFVSEIEKENEIEPIDER